MPTHLTSIRNRCNLTWGKSSSFLPCIAAMQLGTMQTARFRLWLFSRHLPLGLPERIGSRPLIVSTARARSKLCLSTAGYSSSGRHRDFRRNSSGSSCRSSRRPTSYFGDCTLRTSGKTQALGPIAIPITRSTGSRNLPSNCAASHASASFSSERKHASSAGIWSRLECVARLSHPQIGELLSRTACRKSESTCALIPGRPARTISPFSAKLRVPPQNPT